MHREQRKGVKNSTVIITLVFDHITLAGDIWVNKKRKNLQDPRAALCCSFCRHINKITKIRYQDIHLFITNGNPERSWWRHQMETFPALLAICAGNSTVSGEFPAQRPVTPSFDVLFDQRPNKRLSKQSWSWQFETHSSPLWRHSNVGTGLRHHDCCWYHGANRQLSINPHHSESTYNSCLIISVKQIVVLGNQLPVWFLTFAPAGNKSLWGEHVCVISLKPSDAYIRQ